MNKCSISINSLLTDHGLIDKCCKSQICLKQPEEVAKPWLGHQKCFIITIIKKKLIRGLTEVKNIRPFGLSNRFDFCDRIILRILPPPKPLGSNTNHIKCLNW